MVPLFALHLMDGAVAPLGCVLGFVGAAALVALGLYRLRDDEIPRVALVTAAFFVASAIHIKAPPSSVHLVLNGLVGVILGRRAGTAVFLGLTLQFAFLTHGGASTLGVNTVLLGGPALVAGELFRRAAPRFARSPLALAWAGAILGSGTVLASLGLQTAVLIATESSGSAVLWFGLHLPIVLVEGAIVAIVTAYLARVQPAMLGLTLANGAVSPPDSTPQKK